MPRGRKSRPLSERLWSRVVLSDTGCLEWTGGVNKQGRGCIGVRDASRPNGIRMELTHRVAWTEVNGPIPDGKFVLHHCDNPVCCNVWDTENHCYLGDQVINMQERSAHGRHHQGIGRSITKELIQEIRQRLDAGEQGIALAREYSLSPQNISCIRLRQSWK